MKTIRLILVLGLSALSLATASFIRAQAHDSAPIVSIVDAPSPVAPVVSITADDSAAAADPVATLIAGFAVKYPVIVSILSLVGLLRVVFKPIVAWLHARAAATPGLEDDERLAKIEASWWMRALRFVLDWGASIKLR